MPNSLTQLSSNHYHSGIGETVKRKRSPGALVLPNAKRVCHRIEPGELIIPMDELFHDKVNHLGSKVPPNAKTWTQLNKLTRLCRFEENQDFYYLYLERPNATNANFPHYLRLALFQDPYQSTLFAPEAVGDDGRKYWFLTLEETLTVGNQSIPQKPFVKIRFDEEGERAEWLNLASGTKLSGNVSGREIKKFLHNMSQFLALRQVVLNDVSRKIIPYKQGSKTRSKKTVNLRVLRSIVGIGPWYNGFRVINCKDMKRSEGTKTITQSRQDFEAACQQVQNLTINAEYSARVRSMLARHKLKSGTPLRNLLKAVYDQAIKDPRHNGDLVYLYTHFLEIDPKSQTPKHCQALHTIWNAKALFRSFTTGAQGSLTAE